MGMLKTRIQNKIDSETNWNNVANFIPKSGEFIIYSPDSTHANPRIKVGDGETTISSLKFSDSECIKNTSKTVNIIITSANWVQDNDGYYTYQYNNDKINIMSKVYPTSSSISTNIFVLYEVYDGHVLFTTSIRPTSNLSCIINITE